MEVADGRGSHGREVDAGVPGWADRLGNAQWGDPHKHSPGVPERRHMWVGHGAGGGRARAGGDWWGGGWGWQLGVRTCRGGGFAPSPGWGAVTMRSGMTAGQRSWAL